MQKKSTIKKRKKKSKKKKPHGGKTILKSKKDLSEPIEPKKKNNIVIENENSMKQNGQTASQVITNKEIKKESIAKLKNDSQPKAKKLYKIQEKELPLIKELSKKKKQLKYIDKWTLSHNREILCEDYVLNNELPKIKRKERKILKEISLNVKSIPDLIVKSNLDKKYNREIISKLMRIGIKRRENNIFSKEKEDFIEDSEKIKHPEKIEVNEDGKGDGIESELPLFDNILKSKGSRFPCDIDSEYPYVIFIPTSKKDKYIDMLWLILREIFRKLTEKGKPISKKHDKKEILEEELEAECNIELIQEKGNDFIINFPSKEKRFYYSKEKLEKVDIELLKNRLKELISQGFGFIIFNISKDLIENIKSEIEKESWIPEIIDFEPKLNEKLIIQELELITDVESLKQESDEPIREIIPKFEETEKNLEKLKSIKRRITSYFWGLVEPITDKHWINGKTFDDFFCACERDYRKKLRRIFKKAFITINNEKIILKNDKKVKFDLSEGKLHRRMKVFVLEHLINNENNEWKNIKVEEKGTTSEVIPDILINEVEPYEIETFYGRGDPEERIIELIKKYQNKTDFSRIRIIITNLDAILWNKEFLRINNEKRKENIEVEFLTLDLKNNKLINIRKLKSLFLKDIKDFSSNKWN